MLIHNIGKSKGIRDSETVIDEKKVKLIKRFQDKFVGFEQKPQ